MSWAAHNVEEYTEIVKNGITDYLERLVLAYGYDDYDRNTLEVLVEAMESEGSKFSKEKDKRDLYTVFDKLEWLSGNDIINREADHWGGLIDDAKERLGG